MPLPIFCSSATYGISLYDTEKGVSPPKTKSEDLTQRLYWRRMPPVAQP